MADDKLNANQRWALFNLMARNGEASNPELKEAVQLTLTGKDRTGLVDLKLIESEKEGRSFRHSLTEDGWKWLDAELSAQAPDGSNPAGRTMYEILHMVRRLLDNSDTTLIEASQTATAAPEPVDLADRIQLAYRKLAERPGAWVNLTDVRAQLPPADRADVDNALIELNRSPRVHVLPAANQKVLTQADREAAVRISGEDKHQIAIEDA